MGKRVELSIILPTYNEKENVEMIVRDIFSEFKKESIEGEVVIVDDNSPDGTGELAEQLRKKYSYLSVIHRKGKLGLSSAVMCGFDFARGKILGVMDADLSHPPQRLGSMYRSISIGEANLVIGSRYVKGGGIVGWGWQRKLMSRVATLFARPLVDVHDPMSGYFLIRREIFGKKAIDVRGFKILLAILMHCRPRVVEVPILFINRKKGKSKASWKEILWYLRNIFQYYLKRRT